MSPGIQRDFPLFPLGIVALPTETVPLHVFEDRYRALVDACLEDDRPFGIVWLADDGLRDIGCACEITEEVERLPDGRINILTRGIRALRILERQDDLAFPAGRVEFLDDRDEPADPAAAEAAREAYAELVFEATDERPEPADLDRLSAYAMAATVDFGPAAKQGLLELRSENARLWLVARLMRSALKRLEFVTRARGRAQSNGKVRFD